MLKFTQEICKLNNLSPSAMRMTPVHLLHTRSFLILPPTSKPHPSLKLDNAKEKAQEDKLVKKQAEKKVQMLINEVDWRVAKVHVALADSEEEQEEFYAKQKELSEGGSSAAPWLLEGTGMMRSDKQEAPGGDPVYSCER